MLAQDGRGIQLPTLWFGVLYRKCLRTKREGQGVGRERAGGGEGGRQGAGRADARTGVDGSCCGNEPREELRDATWRTGLRPPAPAQGGRRVRGADRGATVWVKLTGNEIQSKNGRRRRKKGVPRNEERGDLRRGLTKRKCGRTIKTSAKPTQLGDSEATGDLSRKRHALWFEIHFQLTEFWYKKRVRSLLFFSLLLGGH